MRNKLLATASLAVALAFGPQAQADMIIPFAVSGDGLSASGSFTITPDPTSGDPAGGYAITGVSGTFSDSNVGLSDVAMTGVVADLDNEKGNQYAASLSRMGVDANGLLPMHDNNSLTYDNLFYPDGAPDVCNDDVLGGFLDVLGAFLTLNNGDVINLWADSGTSATSILYGFALAAPEQGDFAYKAIDYSPNTLTMTAREPASLWLFATALLGGLAFSRRPRRAGQAAPALA